METRTRGWYGTSVRVAALAFGLVSFALVAGACSDGGVGAGDSTDTRSAGTDDTGATTGDSTGAGYDDTGSGGTTGGTGDTGSSPPPDTGGGTGGDTAPGTDTSQPPQVYRFIAMGDTGEANTEQKKVSASAQKRCDQLGGCHGFLMLGDNIYDDGADSAMDKELTTKIDKPYRNLKYGAPPPSGQPDNRKRMPIYVALGNHDLGGTGLESQRIQYYLDYAKGKPWFYYPAEYWEKRVGPVHMVSIHTNPLAYLGNKTKPQGNLVDRVVQNTSANWTIVFGHHEYRSNGQHGNAGSYEGIPGDTVAQGGEYREWINKHVCDKVDFLITAHDHNRQWIKQMPELTGDILGGSSNDPCETHLAISGAGAKTRDIVDRDNDLAFGEPTLGFLLLEFHPKKVNVEFCDKNGTPEWSKTITK